MKDDVWDSMTARTYQVQRLIVLLMILTLCASWLVQFGPWSHRERIVVYCAHDSIYADEVLSEFERRTGVRVDVRYDTEATKSLGLVEQIAREQQSPQCDVFWNNELLGTLWLQSRDCLEPYQGPGWQSRPETARDPAGAWVGFGARLRVWLARRDKFPVLDEAVLERVLSAETLSVAIAEPLYGTTLTQYAYQWHVEGGEALQAWHRNWLQRGVQVLAGNARTKDAAVAGTCDLALTDTDDASLALQAGEPMVLAPLRIAGKTIAIPNTAAIVRGTRHRSAAERLIDFLASPEVELMLAQSRARQVPLGPLPEGSTLPDDVAQFREWSQDAADLRDLLPDRDACLTWLKQARLQP